MVQNITPPAPPSPAITIQPLTTPAGSQDSASLALRNIPIGALVEGFVVNRDAQQNPILRTPVGDVLIKSEIFLKTGSEVVFRIDANIESRARIITIDGLNPQDYAVKTTVNPATDEILGSSLLPESRVAIANTPNAPQASVLLPALLLSPNVLFTQNLPPEVAKYWTQIIANIRKDAAITFKIIATELPLPGESQTAAPTPATPVVTPLGTTRTTNSSPTTAPTPAAADSATVQQIPTPLPESIAKAANPPAAQPASTPQPLVQTAPNPSIATTIATTKDTQPSTVTVTTQTAVTASAPPSPPPLSPIATSVPRPISAPSLPNQKPQLIAHVIGHEFDGANIIQTPVGTFKLLAAHPLPTGSKITLEVPAEHQPLPATANAPLLPTDLEEFTSLARDWSSLRDALTALAAHDPALANQLINTAIPKPHAKMTSEMLFLFAAIKSGSPEEWFGKRAIEMLDLRSPEILKRLNKDFAQLQQVFSDALPQWMSVIVPFYSDAQLQQIRMFFKHEDDGGKKGKEGGGQRFIIELDLSHLGDMQLDGFVKKSPENKYFDLVVRSARSLPTSVEQGIRQIFDTALQTTGYKGYVNFQQGIHHFVRPLESVKEALSADTRTILA